MNAEQIALAQALHDNEMGRGPDANAERLWLRWVDVVEAHLDIDTLDGSDDEEGYSLDTAHDWFEDGVSPQTAAARFLNRMVKA